jgi:hypothetical protein
MPLPMTKLPTALTRQKKRKRVRLPNPDPLPPKAKT